MKKLVFLVIILASANTAFAQLDTNKTDANNLRTGFWKELINSLDAVGY